MEPVYLDTNKFINGKKAPAFLRLMLNKFQTAGYIPVPEYLQELSDYDLSLLNGMIESLVMATDEEYDDKELPADFPYAYASLVLMIVAEGDVMLNTDNINLKVKMAITFLTFESLHRKGVGIFHRHVATFGQSNNEHEVIFSPHEDLLRSINSEDK